MTDEERPAGGWPGDATRPPREEPPAEGIWAEPVAEPAPEPAVEADATTVPEPVFEAAPDEGRVAGPELELAGGEPTPDDDRAPGDEPTPVDEPPRDDGRAPGDEPPRDDDPAPGDEPPRDDDPAPGDEPPRDDDEPTPDGDGRALSLRLARLHLRMGSLSLARAELEAHAGGALLDEPALVDLAEARWRTGDLAGAGEAAHAALERGVKDPVAYVIAAESIAAVGRPGEARRLAGRALDGLDITLDALFAGMPRSLIWPGDPEPEVATVAAAGEDRSPASAAAAEAFAGGRGALARGDVPTAALRLSLAIRLEPRFAQGVLTAIGERGHVPLLALVAGDALRLLGREQEALDAYERARALPRVPEPPAAAGPAEDDPDAD